MKKIVFLSLMFLVSCSANKILNKDFSFKYKSYIDSYDSKTEIFTRRTINSKEKKYDSLQIKVKLSETELNKIRNSFLKNDFTLIPENFDNPLFDSRPKIKEQLIFRNQNSSKNVNFTYGVGDEFESTGKKILKINKVIEKILYSKKEIKNLEKSNIFLR